ncbi:hypothetical protein [Caldimonas manganoxidans]|uniref:hypothetical protein n=1 Tax=Caldimonas manganoxidans TaxID=196015 RepID=UPI00036CE1F2|nr:hypothetical protein [Caldimonas manganoxidans]
MTIPLIPQEIYLLERYSSLDYFGQMRDHFAQCVKAAEDALAEFMRHLPPDYRSRPLHQQPDAVWGERVIPNMQWALAGLNDGYIRISHGDLDGLGFAGNVKTTFASINRDYHIDWMPQPYQSRYDEAQILASEMASNISHTEQGSWSYGTLSFAYHEPSRGPLNPPASWPVYRINEAVQVRTGQKVPKTGIYLPAHGPAAAALLIEGQKAIEAEVCTNAEDLLRDPKRSRPQSRREPTVWTLVERVADEGGDNPMPATGEAALRLECEAGQPCPRMG